MKISQPDCEDKTSSCPIGRKLLVVCALIGLIKGAIEDHPGDRTSSENCSTVEQAKTSQIDTVPFICLKATSGKSQFEAFKPFHFVLSGDLVKSTGIMPVDNYQLVSPS